MLQETEFSRGLAGKYIDTYVFADGHLEVRWKGVPLPYCAFDSEPANAIGSRE